MQLWWFGIAAVAATFAEGAKILSFLPMPAKSHQAFFQPLLRELAKRGHKITSYATIKLPNPPPGYTEVMIPMPKESADGKVEMDFVAFGKMSPFFQEVLMRKMTISWIEQFLSSDVVQQLINSEEKFDAVILESLFFMEGFSAFQHKFDAVPIEIMPLGNNYWLNEMVGNPHNPSYMVDFWIPSTNRMNFLERLYNTVNVLWISALSHYYMRQMQNVTDTYFMYKGWETRPSIQELAANKSIVIVNSHFTLNYPEPLSPHIIEAGGMHIQPNKPLPKDLQTFMDEAKEGVIYFSMGSNLQVSDFAKGGILDAFVKAFGKIKQKVLWKWETDDLPGKPPNVKIAKWFPQQDIMAHKNCIMFITHGGYLSVSESAYFGVPIIGIPIFGDQFKNMKQVTLEGYGIELQYDDISTENILKSINEILNNPFYKGNALKISKLFRDRPKTALENAAYWVEYAIKYNGAPHLRTALSTLKWYEALLLDVLAVVLGVVALVFILTYLMVRKFCSMILRWVSRSETKKTKKKTN